MVGLDTLYGVLSEEHLGLQITLKEVTRRLRLEETKRRELEMKLTAASINDNPINLALAERIQALEQSEAKLRRENIDLREENDLLEFRLLELDDSSLPTKRVCNNKTTVDIKSEPFDIDDVSDSGVMSLPTSDDEHHDFNMEGRSDRDVKSRLLSMCQSASTVSERICLQQALALLRHYEARIEGLESTIAAMCHEAAMSRTLYKTGRLLEAEFDEKNAATSGRIIATVLPFTEPPTSDVLTTTTNASVSAKMIAGDCGGSSVNNATNGTRTRTQADSLTESGVFEAEDEDDDDDEDDLVISLYTRGTQTESSYRTGEDSLTAELEKLSRIKEKIEEKKGENSQNPQPKDILFYESRVSALEARLAAFESNGDERNKILSAQLEREILLSAQVNQLKERLAKLTAENRRLEEERSEIEEIENDTRLRCQKLELKVSALSDKKKGLKKQVEDLRLEMSHRDNEERSHLSRMEQLVNTYEQKNQELEERELEVRYRLQMLENSMPALMMWNLWRMMMIQTSGGAVTNIQPPPGLTPHPGAYGRISGEAPHNREEELMAKLKSLEVKLSTETRLLEDSRLAENQLRKKIKDLEKMLVSKDNNILEILNRDPQEDQEIFEKLSKMAKERVDMDKRIRDLELKEKIYQETLQQADNMFAQMEGSFLKQIKEKDDLISAQESCITDSNSRLRQASKSNVLAEKLQEKLVKLDEETAQLRDLLVRKDQEKERLERQLANLETELRNTISELESVRQTIVGPLTDQVEFHRKRAQSLEQELRDTTTRETAEMERHRNEVSSLNLKIKHLTREILENEVTIGELREEVQTLETAVFEVRAELSKARSDSEELRERYEAMLEDKEHELEMMMKERSTAPIVTPRSIKEELDDIIIIEGDGGAETLVPEMRISKGTPEWKPMEAPRIPPPPLPSAEETPEITVDTQLSECESTNQILAFNCIENDLHYGSGQLYDSSITIIKQKFTADNDVTVDSNSSLDDTPLFLTNLPAVSVLIIIVISKGSVF
ncbi:hypothetical protein O3M35_005992 [Rhynocoris fuscipes]|uniref:Uncharacterized protein n=1 Tax=Rhynocoris fuscipes TaxID=488301 RepID=A0AAW1DEA3_9HEMI